MPKSHDTNPSTQSSHEVPNKTTQVAMQRLEEGKGKPFNIIDIAVWIEDREAIAIFLADAFDTDDASYIAEALGMAARAKGMTEIARETGLAREQLYRSFSVNGNPTLKNTIAVMKALGIDLTAKVHAPSPPEH